MDDKELKDAIIWAIGEMDLEQDPNFIKKVLELDMTL